MQGAKRSAELELPTELYGGNLPGLFASFGLTATQITGNRWNVHAATTPAGQHHELVTARMLAGPKLKSPRFDLLPTVVDELPAYQMTPKVQARLQKLREAAAAAGGKMLTQFHHFQVELMVADVDRCEELVERCFEFLSRVVREGSNEPLFPDRSAHVVTATGMLLHRVKLPSIVLRIAQDPQVIDELRTGTAQYPNSGLMFSSAAQQSNSLVLNGSFMGPLMGCLLPYMWAFPCPRLLSTIIFGFGRTLPAAGNDAKELLRLLPLAGPNANPEPPPFGAAATSEAIDWWVLRLNQLFRYLTDPATYIDSNGLYAPHEQQHWMLTIDQILRLTTSLQAAVHDTTSQRVLAFTLLGSFADRLFDKKVDLKKLFTLSYARTQFDAVKAAMPTSAAEVLLPAAQRALDALEKVQDGFFITGQRNARAVTIQLSAGQSKSLNLEDAAARLMVVHRNATHGYGGIPNPRNKENVEINERLLAHHDGKIPGDIALLPYLYLLLTLSRPEDVRDRIINHVEQI